jgi:hypothetical protein
MLQPFYSLSGKGLLAAMVATLVSGHTIADVAGRVTFVVGQVTATGSDGSQRVLNKGELLNSGERLETGSGRLQIRFTDGSLMSLQPNTVFGLDSYSFNRTRPQEGSLLFNFIRGSMRTVSGAIGRVNRANYKVKTPVGTIGIRGTGYTATQEPNGRLLVTVNKGMVNISNDFGNRDIPTGQTFQIFQGQAPEPAAAGVVAEALATAPNTVVAENREERQDNSPPAQQRVAEGEANLGLDVLNPHNDIEQSNQSDQRGRPQAQVFPFFIQSVNGIPRLNHVASLLPNASNSLIKQNILAAYDVVSSDGLSVGNLVGILDKDNETLLLDTRNVANPIKFNSVKQVGTLSFGEWTNGQMATANNSVNINTLSLGANTFVPYIVGTTHFQNLGANQGIRYRLADLSHATPARAGQSMGQLSKLNIDVDLNIQPLVSVDMALSLEGVNYTASLQNHPLDLILAKTLQTFRIDGAQDNFFATTSNNTLCANKTCPVNLEGFFSGINGLGAVYLVERPNNLADIGGVAALTGIASNMVSAIAPNAKVENSLTPKYTVLFSNNAGINLSPNPATPVAALFNSQTGGLQLAFTDKDNSYGIVGTRQGAAQTSQIAHQNNLLSWGVWSNGSVDLNDSVQQSYDLNGKQQVHYIIGSPTLNLPTNRVTYSFADGTTPTVDGAANTQAQLSNQSYLNIDFGANTAALQLNLQLKPTTGSSQTLSATGTSTLNAGSFNFNNLTVKLGSGNSCNSLGCSGSATGFFVGDAAQWAALNYSISAVSDTFNNGQFIHTQGVAGFKQDANFVIPATQLSNNNALAYTALLSTQINDNPQIDISLQAATPVSAQFNSQTQAWESGRSANANTPNYGYKSPTPTANMASEVTHHKQTLSWGRWINSDVSVGSSNNPVKLGANDNVHYLIGTPTASLPTLGSVSYVHAGSTTPTGTLTTPTMAGSPASTISPLTGVSVLNNSVVQVDFASTANNAIKMDMNFGTGALGNINFKGQSALSTSFSLNNLTVNNQACTNCAANGFFAGSAADMVGLNYEVSAKLGNSTANMTGVAAFEKP